MYCGYGLNPRFWDTNIYPRVSAISLNIIIRMRVELN
jgi:hypothetical protein